MKYIYCIIAAIPIVVYLLNFMGHAISNNPENWAFFGDYIGGVYSVVLTCVLTFLMYQLNKKDEYNRERLCIIKDLYSNIRKFENTNPLRIAEVNSFTNKIIDNELILPSNIFEKLIEFSDYYKGIANNNNRDVQKESEIKKLLKEYYNEQRN
jgi:hypothetical protein|nr:MAG TPA: hypothetical protein [Caudoviricetes sp.]